MAQICITIENKKITKELYFMGKTYVQEMILIEGVGSLNIAVPVYEDFPDLPRKILDGIADILRLNACELERLVEDMRSWEYEQHQDQREGITEEGN